MKITGRRLLLGAVVAAAVAGWGGKGTLPATVRTVESAAFTKVSALGVEEQRVSVIADLDVPPGTLGDGYRTEARIVTWAAAEVEILKGIAEGERVVLHPPNELRDGLRVATR